MANFASSWSTQQLTEFLAHLSSLPDEGSALRAAAERAAEALDAEVGAVIADGRVASCTGFRQGEAPAAALFAVARAESDTLDVPGVGRGRAITVPLEESPNGWLVVARVGVEDYTLDEMNLLRGMARTLTLTVRMLRLIKAERELRTQSERHARDNSELLNSVQERQLLLEGMSAIQRAISHRRPLQGILDSITAKAQELLRAEMVALRLIDLDDPDFMTMVSSAGLDPNLTRSLRRNRVGEGAGGLAIKENRLVVIENYPADPNAIPGYVVYPRPIQAAMAAPIHDNGRVIGSLTVASSEEGRAYGHAERTAITAFAEQASLAITDARTVEAMHEARHDPVTGLPNRALFIERLAARLGPHGPMAAIEMELAVLFLDLDRFKNVNDSLGHAAGDELLVGVARRLQACLRPTDTVARLGGDEFTIMLDEVSGEADAVRVATRILDAIREPFTICGRSVFVTASVGVVLARAGRDEVDQVLRGADLAMYQAKGTGGARTHVFHPELNERAIRRIELEAELREAVEKGQFHLCYQPLVDLNSGRIGGFEALVRWEHPTRGTVPPAEFIGLAEETGLIVPLGAWVLEEACRQARAWPSDPAFPSIEVHVNLSVRQFQQPTLVEFIDHLLTSTGLEPGRLTLEITESVLMQDAESTVMRLNSLRALGVRLAIDDFGTGYSSLSYLKQFPVDVVKMDRSFVQTLGDAPQDEAFARAIVELARILRLRTVAEGIETAAQLAVLRRLGCPEGQGFYFSRPVPLEEARRLILDGGMFRVPRTRTRRRPADDTYPGNTYPGDPHPIVTRASRPRVVPLELPAPDPGFIAGRDDLPDTGFIAAAG